MRDPFLVLLTLGLALGGIASGLVYVRGVEGLSDLRLDVPCIATLLLLTLAVCTWMVTVRTRERGRYSHLPSADRVEMATRGEVEERSLTRRERARYRVRVAELELEEERAAAGSGPGGIPQHVYDEFSHPKEYYEALMPKETPGTLPDDDPHVSVLREWSDETVIIEDGSGRRVYHEGPPEPQWVKDNRKRPGMRRWGWVRRLP